MDLLTWVILGIVCGCIASIIAKNKGRSEFGWGLSGFILGPFVLLVFLLPPIIDGKILKKCPFCAEPIKVNAIKCKFCSSNLQ